LDEFATGFYDIAHQFGENVIRIGKIVNFDLQQGARLWVKGCLPQLAWVHLTQTLIALQGQALFTFRQNGIQQLGRAMDDLATFFTGKMRWLCKNLACFGADGGELARLARPQNRTIKVSDFFHPAQNAAKADPMILGDTPLPSALVFHGDQIKARRDLIRNTLKIAVQAVLVKAARKRGLFKDVTGIMGWEGLKNTAEGTRTLNNTR
jgi:hypothetical protein